MDILKWLSQNGQLFPFPPEIDEIMGQQSESVENALTHLRKTLDAEQLQQLQVYLEQSQRLQDMERQLVYENGFLFAVALCLEIVERLSGDDS